MKTGEAVTELLVRYGVRHVFGIPGTHSLELYRGLAGESPITHVLAHHEQGAGFMADGYARVTGQPGVCFVITGPGVTNLATPMGTAYADSVPMLVISPVNPVDGGGHNRGRLHEITDQAAVTAPLTAFSAVAQTQAEIVELVARAFAVFGSARPRPVHISIPLPLLDQSVATEWSRFDVPVVPVAPASRIAEAKEWIEDTRRPLIVAGGGTRFSAGAVVRLAERMGCPVVTTVAARGVIPGSHPLCAGAQLRAAAAQELLEESDLVILLGTELAQTDHWSDQLSLPPRQIRINIDDRNLTSPGKVLAIKGDAGDAAERLAKVLAADAQSARANASAERCATLSRQLIHSMTDREQQHWQILTVLRDYLPENVQVFSDMTQIAYTAIDFMPLERPNSWHHPIGYGVLGYALPAAIGGAIARPGCPTVALVGDAGLQYTMQELPLAAELKLNLKILLWDNNRLEQIRDDMVGAGIPPLGVTQRNPDFDLLAKCCGWEYQRVNDLDSLGVAVGRAFASPGCALLHIDARGFCPS